MAKFIQARNYTWVSDFAPRQIDLINIHTMEMAEKGDTAESCALYFRNQPKHDPSKGHFGSSAHYCIDNNTVVQCVKDKDVAWAAPGANHNGLQLEHAGYARQLPRDWNDPFSRAMLVTSAGLAAKLARKYNIPVRWLSVSDLKAGKRGFTSHANVSLAFRRSNHTDPGVGFPVHEYLQLVKESLGDAKPKPQAPPSVFDGLPGPSPKPGWFWKAVEELDRRRKAT